MTEAGPVHGRPRVRTTFALYARNFRVLVGIMILAALPIVVLDAVVSWPFVGGLDPARPFAWPSPATLVVGAVVGVIAAGFTILGTMAELQAIGDALCGRSASVAQTLRTLKWPHVWRTAGTWLMETALFGIPAVLANALAISLAHPGRSFLILLALYVAMGVAGIYLLFVMQVTVLERVYGLRAFRRSFELARGRFWGLVGRLLWFALVVLLPVLIVLTAVSTGITLSAVSSLPPGTAPTSAALQDWWWLYSIAYFLLNVLIAPLLYIYWSQLYFWRRAAPGEPSMA